MTDLVRDHVGTRKIARRAEPLMQFLEERQIEIDFLIQRAVERTHRRLRKATLRLHRVAEQHQLRLAILLSVPPELLVPHVLRLRQHDRDEVRLLVHALVRARLPGRYLFRRRPAARHYGTRIYSQQCRDQREHDGTDTTARYQTAATAAVLYVRAASATLPAHNSPPEVKAGSPSVHDAHRSAGDFQMALRRGTACLFPGRQRP